MDTMGVTMTLDGSRRVAKPGAPVPVPQLVLALECSRPRALSSRYSLGNVTRVRIGRGTSRKVTRRDASDGRELVVQVADRWMSGSHAHIEVSFGRWVLVDQGSKNGSIVNGEPVRRATLHSGDLIELGHTLFLFDDSMTFADDEPSDLDLDAETPRDGLATLNPELARELSKLSQVARSPISVLIEGESGTGKEVLARAVHDLSERPGAFVAVNCGAIPANLVESELFGHRRGAFSGAIDDKPGLIRSADGGTSFLDEIGDLPAASQAALLRVLQEREVMPVGASRPTAVDFRCIAATHRRLEQQVSEGQFRQDLFARLNGFRVRLPALRERREDLGLLISTLFRRITGDRQDHPGFECDAARKLFDHDWPMNIRELEQCLATAYVLAGDDTIDVRHLSDAVRKPPRSTGRVESASRSTLTEEDEARRTELTEQLQQHKGNISAVARSMGKDRKQIQRWLKRFDLDATRFRD